MAKNNTNEFEKEFDRLRKELMQIKEAAIPKRRQTPTTDLLSLGTPRFRAPQRFIRKTRVMTNKQVD